ncbi:MAG TPA: hypothetical protein ENK89_05890 [Desulfobulbaceae bacterium]|nr:hypothetical protein [Desulfobulbaceae bacterium]
MSSFFGKGKARRSWFERRRDYFVCQAVADFFRFVGSFHKLYQDYLQCRNPEGAGGDIDLLAPHSGERRQRMWDRLRVMIGSETDKGQLWQLKDICHVVWPEHDREHTIHGALIDWFVGSVFHEAMKLKENIYLLNTYGPAALQIQGLSSQAAVGFPDAGSSLPHLSSMVDVEPLIRKISIDVGRQMEQIGILLGQASCILRIMIPELSENSLVVRLLIEEEETVRALWGEDAAAVLADMFAGSSALGFCAAARSYLAGQWYQEALDMYGRALACDERCDEAQEKIAEIRAMPEMHEEPFAGSVNTKMCCRSLSDRRNGEPGFCRDNGS